MPVERLTAVDELMLWADQIWPQDIGAVAVLDGTELFDRGGCFRIEAVRQAIARRLHLVPRFRQLLYVPPLLMGGPLWVDAPDFDIADHIRSIALPASGDEPELLVAVEQLRRRQLDRSRPLWEMWFLTGLPRQRVGLFMRTHHCLADGIAGVATMAAFLDVDANSVNAPGPMWTPAPPPSTEDLRADHLRRQIAERRRRWSLLAHPVSSARRLLATWPAMRELLAEEALPATSLDHVVGPGRKLALVRANIDLVEEIAHTHEAKVNDVLLTVIAGGLRELLRSRGEPIPQLMRAYVPVSMRHGQYSNARGNLIAQMVVPLPVTVSDPVVRLQQIARETAKRKARPRPSLGGVPHRGLAGRAFLKLIDRQRVNVTTADLPGPRIPLYLAGGRLLEVFPLLPLIGRVSLGVGAMSYAEQFNITAVADRDSYPDLDTLAAGVRGELRVLEAKVLKPAVA